MSPFQGEERDDDPGPRVALPLTLGYMNEPFQGKDPYPEGVQ